MNDLQLLKTKDVMKLLGVARSTIYEQMRVGGFPAPIKLGLRDNRWRLSEIKAWELAKAQLRKHAGLSNTEQGNDGQ